MNLEVSEKCPECGYDQMKEQDREIETISSIDIDIEPDYKDISLDEWCPECGFSQTIYANCFNHDE